MSRLFGAQDTGVLRQEPLKDPQGPGDPFRLGDPLGDIFGSCLGGIRITKMLLVTPRRADASGSVLGDCVSGALSETHISLAQHQPKNGGNSAYSGGTSGGTSGEAFFGFNFRKITQPTFFLGFNPFTPPTPLTPPSPRS